MTRKQLNSIVLAAAFAVLVMSATETWAKKPGGGGGGGAAYTIVPFLPPNSQSISSSVEDLNDQGHAVGFVTIDSSPTGTQAVHLDIATNAYTTLQDGLIALGVNNLNQIVGTVSVNNYRHAAFWRGPSAVPIILPSLPGEMDSDALSINDAGIIVGRSVPVAFEKTGVVWRVVIDSGGNAQVDGPLPLAPLPGDSSSHASDINEVVGGQAQVAGSSNDYPEEAAVWIVGLNPDGTLAAPGAPVGLGTLGLSNPSLSTGFAINNFGDVCGMSDQFAVIAPAGQGVQLLPMTRDADGGHAWDVNDLGVVVGRLNIVIRGSKTPVVNPHASLWKNGKAILLETQIGGGSGWGGRWDANAINTAGIIGGRGYFDVNSRGFLMFPNN